MTASEQSRDTLAAIVLAGGQSTRMGADKASTLWQGRPLLTTVVEALAPACGTTFVVASEASAAFQELGDGAADVVWVTGEIPGNGPLGGLAAGLSAAQDAGYRAAFICATDMPLLDAAIVDELSAGLAEPDDAVIATAGGREHPLAGIYRTRCLETVAGMVNEGELRLLSLADRLRIHRVSVSNPDWLTNVNAPEDLHRLRVTT